MHRLDTSSLLLGVLLAVLLLAGGLVGGGVDGGDCGMTSPPTAKVPVSTSPTHSQLPNPCHNTLTLARRQHHGDLAEVVPTLLLHHSPASCNVQHLRQSKSNAVRLTLCRRPRSWEPRPREPPCTCLLTAADTTSTHSCGGLGQALLLDLGLVSADVLGGSGVHHQVCDLDVTQLGILGQLLLLQTRPPFQNNGQLSNCLHHNGAPTSTTHLCQEHVGLPGACRL